MSKIRPLLHIGVLVCVLGLLSGQGCPTPTPNGNVTSGSLVFSNTTDRTNNNAEYIGSDACNACHPDVAAAHLLHGHAFKLQATLGGPPSYPQEADRAGVPNPPAGKEWADVTLAIGGYIRKARFVDQGGFIMTNDAEGVDTQWNLEFLPTGNDPGFVPYENSGKFSPDDPKPYGFSCFVCHTTGPLSEADSGGLHQFNKPGLEGTWQEEGVQCEACHGPGSNHIPNPAAHDIYVDTEGVTCNECHNRPFASEDGVIRASGGFIRHHEQYPELMSSGGHASLKCTSCHDPHSGTNYDRENAIRNECVVCHSDQNFALHSGKIYVNGDFVERLGCESCHMPYASKTASVAGADVVGDSGGRIADMRTHIFRINTDEVDFNSMFTADGSEVVKDSAGRAAVTVDFVCLRCHNGVGSAFKLTVSSASEIALRMH